MKTLSLLLVLALSSQALADPPADAPLAPAIKLKAGQPAPVDGMFESDAKAIDSAKQFTSCKAERDDLVVHHMSPLVVVAIAVGAAVLGGAAGIGGFKVCQDRGGCK